MLQKILFLFFLIGMGGMLNAQKHTPTDNTIPSTSCECFTFEDACSGEELELTGSVTLYCDEIWDGKPWSRTFPIVDGKACFRQFMDDCKGARLCINSGNWEVCDISGCTVKVFQTLSTFPRINGDLIGYGWGTPGHGGGSTYCVGRVHSGPLNNIHGRDELFLCPGDPVELDYSGLDVPEESGLCLFVNVKTTGGTVVASGQFDDTQINGSTVDLTSMFSNLDPEIYIIEFRLACCSGEESCTVNTYKYAYIEIKGTFDYTPSVDAGFVPNNISFTPSSTFPGTQLPPGIPFPPNTFNVLNLIGQGVTATEDIDVDWTLDVVDCDDGDFISQTNSGTITVLEGDLGFSTGAIPIMGSPSVCTCMRMSLTYYDRCEDSDSSFEYFFKDGPDCPNFQAPEDDDAKLRSSGGTSFNIKVVPNPIQSDLRFTIDENLIGAQGKLKIQNTAGQVIFTQSYKALSESLMVNFDSATGVYFYEMQVGEETYTGKFVKM